MTTKTATLRMPRRRTYPAATPRRRRKSRAVSSGELISFKTIAAVAVLVLLLVAAGLTSWKVREVATQLESFQADYQQEMTEQKRIAANLSRLMERKHLEEMGRSIGLHPASKEQIRIIRQ